MKNDDLFKNAMLSVYKIKEENQESLFPFKHDNFYLKKFYSPVQLKTTRTNLMDNYGHKVLISETRKASFINKNGFYEEVEEKNIRMLDDGTSTCGVVICQTCGGTVKEQNIKRCHCGKTVCIRPGCGWKISGKWYCSFLCSFFG